MSLNTEREGADVEAVAGLADATGADVLVLPETTQRYGRRLAEALTELKKSGAQPSSFEVFSDTGMLSDLVEQGIDQNSDPAYSTTVLVASLCRRPPAGLIVAGDFNATRDHAPLRNLGGCISAGEQAGIGGLATWPSSTGTTLLGATIDHIFVDGTVWEGKGGRIITIPGTDHRAVVVQLSD